MKRIITFIVAVSFVAVSGAMTGADKLPESKRERGIKSLIYGLENGNKGLKVSCALIIGEYGIVQATDALASVINSGEDTDVKYAAMVALYKMKTKAAGNILKSAAREIEDPYLKELAKVFYSDIQRREAEAEYAEK